MSGITGTSIEQFGDDFYKFQPIKVNKVENNPSLNDEQIARINKIDKKIALCKEYIEIITNISYSSSRKKHIQDLQFVIRDSKATRQTIKPTYLRDLNKVVDINLEHDRIIYKAKIYIESLSKT